MTDDENTNIHTVSVRVPDWLKHCFDDVYDTDAPDYKKLAAVMKDNSALEMTVTDLSDETLDCAAADYCDDWYYLEPEQQQELRENIQDWIVIKDNSSLSMTVTDLSDNTLDLAAADYCDDWYLLEPEQQQELRENIQDWIGALLVAGAISVSPQSNSEIPPLEAE